MNNLKTINNEKKIEAIEIKQSNVLMNSINNLSLNATKIWLLGLATIKFLNENSENSITIDSSGRIITTFKKDFLIRQLPSVMKQKNYIKDLKKYSKELIDNSVGIVQEDKENFKIIGSYATSAVYKNDELQIAHNIDVIDLVDVKNNYCQFLFHRISSLRSKYHLKTYELCIQYIKIGKRQESIEFLRSFYNTGTQFKQNKDFVKRIIESSINAINEDKKIDICVEFNKIKTSKKITHIKFIMRYKNEHPLKQIELKNNDLTTLLVSLGLSAKKIQSLSKYSVDRLLKAAKYTKKQIDNKAIKKNVEACFVGSLKKIEKTETSDLELAQTYIDLLSIEQKNTIQQEFYDSLAINNKATYNSIKDENNKTIKQALINQFSGDYRRWICANKLKK